MSDRETFGLRPCKVVNKAMAAMKKDGSIVSPIRCKWEPVGKEVEACVKALL